ncbi:MAG: aspartate kinase [Bacteroidia bacterium]|nr:aspartate kinase [Bacteroidia bacterium]
MSKLIVMKFGGASVKDAQSVRNVAHILSQHPERPLIFVVSAMGKTTNNLVELAELSRKYKKEEALQQYQKIRDFHFSIINELFENNTTHSVYQEVEKYFTEMQEVIQGIALLREFPFHLHDRIVSFGELISATIVTAYLNEIGLKTQFYDARKIIKTTSLAGGSEVLWEQTQKNVKETFLPFPEHICCVTGYIASNLENQTTTLGREGSDYTAAILSNILEASEMHIWKDVEGVLNADPRRYPNTQVYPQLTYQQAVEMSYYGASVIHPRTIKPLENKQIPLRVKCFLNTSLEGTLIQAPKYITIPPKQYAVIDKFNQILLTITPKDFSFVMEKHIDEIATAITHAKLKANLSQNSALSYYICADNNPEQVADFINELSENFQVQKQDRVYLKTYLFLTERLPDEEFFKAILIQRSGTTAQMVIPE